MLIIKLLKYALFYILILLISGCYPGAISMDPVTTDEVKPQLSKDWLYLRLLKRSKSPLNISDTENKGIGVLAIRQSGSGYELQHPDKREAKGIGVSTVTFHAPLSNTDLLAAVVRLDVTDNGTKEKFIYGVLFMEKIGLTFELIPLSSNFLNEWQPATAKGKKAKRHLLELEKDGGSPILRTEEDLQTAMLAASLFPKEWRTTYMLQKEPPPTEGQYYPTSQDRSRSTNDNWQLRSQTDPITKKVTNYVNLKPDSVAPGAEFLFQFVCEGGTLRVLAINERRPFRNETSDIDLSLGLLEMRVDDKETYKLAWLIGSNSPDILFDPRGLGGFLKFGTMFNYRMKDANTSWGSVWFLNNIANAKSILVRVTDITGTAYLATFSPRFSVRKVVEHLPECLNIK